MTIEYYNDDGEPEPLWAGGAVYEQPPHTSAYLRSLSQQEQAPESPPSPPAPDVDRDLWAEAYRRRHEEDRQREQVARAEELAGLNGRSRRFDVRCSEAEVERWSAAAEAEGISVSEFLRAAAEERVAQLVS